MAEKAGVHAKAQESKQKCSNSCKQNTNYSSSGSPADRILQLQRTAGNQAVQRLIKSRVVQTKLKIGQPNDMFEQEADRVAEQVMRVQDPILQSKCAKRDEDKEKVLQAKNSPGQAPATQNQDVPPVVHEVLRSPGQPLDPITRAFMEPRFGQDFSRVRVHSGPDAEQSARDVNAQAYTMGNDIVFDSGKFVPGTHEGRRLIAHELTHVIQQSESARPGFSIEKQDTQRTNDLLNKQEANPNLLNVVQRKPNPKDEGNEKDVAESVIEAMSQPSSIAGFDVDPAFSILNKYPLPFLLLVLAKVYDRGRLYGLLGYLAPGTKADNKVIVAIRFIQCQKEPSSLAYEEIIEAENFLKGLYDVRLPSELKSSFDCLERERIGHEKRRESERAHIEAERLLPGYWHCILAKGTMQWKLEPPEAVEGKTKKQRMQIKFTPSPSFWNKKIDFIQTFQEISEGSSGSNMARVDIGMTGTLTSSPFYGADWNQAKREWEPEGVDEPERRLGYKIQPSSPSDPAAYLYDEPYFFPNHGRVFESMAVVLETGEMLGGLTWGVGKVPKLFELATCSDRPSAGFQLAVENFYAPIKPSSYLGENYLVILDGFVANDASLTADQEKQLDAIVPRVLEEVAKRKTEPDPNKKDFKALLVQGFGDSMDNDPMGVSEQRAQAVVSYLTGKGIPKNQMKIFTYGKTWARYLPSMKEGRNRRVQLFLVNL